MDSVFSKGKFSLGYGHADAKESLPRISVVVPVYKVEKYLRECVESILSQAFMDFELILVDDGSPDKCGEMCDEIAKLDPRVKVFHQENGGVNSARRLGVEHSRGEWICFVDSDDLLPKNALQDLFDEATDDTDWVEGEWVKFRDGETPTKEDSSKGDVKYFDLLGLIENMLLYHSHPWGKLVRKNLFSPYVFEIPREINVGEDAQMNFRLIANKLRRPKKLGKVVYHYRLRENSAICSRVLTEDYVMRIYELFLTETKKFPVTIRRGIERAISKSIHSDEIHALLRSSAPIKSPQKLALIIRPIAGEKFRYFFSYVCLALGCPKIARARIKISDFLHGRGRNYRTRTLLE